MPVYRGIGKLVGKLSCYRKNEAVQEKDLDTDYENFRTQFLSEYDRSNPITHAKAMKDYFKFLERKTAFTEAPTPMPKIEKSLAVWFSSIKCEAKPTLEAIQATLPTKKRHYLPDSSKALKPCSDP